MFNLVLCMAVAFLVMQNAAHQPSVLWHQPTGSFKMELWALRTAWTSTKSSYSSELNALHYYLRSAEALKLESVLIQNL